MSGNQFEKKSRIKRGEKAQGGRKSLVVENPVEWGELGASDIQKELHLRKKGPRKKGVQAPRRDKKRGFTGCPEKEKGNREEESVPRIR